MSKLLKNSWVFLMLTALLFTLVMRFVQEPPFTQMDTAIFTKSANLVPTKSERIKQVAVVTLQASEHPEGVEKALFTLLQMLEKTKPSSVSVMLPFVSQASHLEVSDALLRLDKHIQNTPLPAQNRQEINALMNELSQHIQIDQSLSAKMKEMGNVFLPFNFGVSQVKLPTFIPLLPAKRFAKRSLEQIISDWLPFYEKPKFYHVMSWPTQIFGESAKGVGYLPRSLDKGRPPFTSLVQPYQDGFLLSLPVLLVTQAMGVEIENLYGLERFQLEAEGFHVSLDDGYRVVPHLYTNEKGMPEFPIYPYDTVLSSDMTLQNLAGKTILIDVLPIGSDTNLHITPETELLAHTVLSLLNSDTYTHSQSMVWLELAILILLGAYVSFLLPRLSFTSASFISLLLLLSLIGLEMYLLLREQLWVYSGGAIMYLVFGYIALGVRDVFIKQQERYSADIYYTNRQFGQLLQDQGKLEQAFECYQKLSSEDEDLGLMYNLALDFERKRKFNNASAAFHYILEHKSDYKDVHARVALAHQMQQTVTMGSGGFHHLGSLLDASKGEKPMLGRFVLERELGKGAMGAVYLGRDPKIDRVVAIKTLALAEEFESTEIKEVEQRFFHEASAAGRLNHPHIVTIYDAAEEHDLAYIAMEYIEGKSLDAFVKKEQLLPHVTVLKIIAKIADALEYAGQQGIVHRDIKPANIMFNEAQNIVKITDFGIARISTSGRTKTGMILGTPSFMSPEQMSGAKVDCRSDIFSLGVTMFVLLTGEKPFTGDSLAAISYKIVNDKHPDITQVRQDLPKQVKTILDKALQKNPDKRYQSAIVMKRAILRCLKTMGDDANGDGK